MRKISLTVLTLFLSSGLMYGCAEKKQPAEKKAQEAAVEKPAVVNEPAPALKTETSEKAVEKKEASPAAVSEVKQRPVEKRTPVLAAPVKEALKEPVASVKDIEAGAAIFKTKCSLCHGADGKGSTMAPAFKGNGWIKGSSTADIADVIKNGRKGPAKKYENFFSDMPASKSMAEKEVNTLVDYIRSIN